LNGKERGGKKRGQGRKTDLLFSPSLSKGEAILACANRRKICGRREGKKRGGGKRGKKGKKRSTCPAILICNKEIGTLVSPPTSAK